MRHIHKPSNTLTAIVALLLFSSTAWGVGGSRKTIIDLAETPLGEYEKKTLPRLKSALPSSSFLGECKVKDQGPIGTCAIFTATGCYEQYDPSNLMSAAEFAVFAETQIDNCIAGINMGNTLKLGQSMGFIEESRLSYDATYLPYVARKNGLDPRVPGWEEILRKKEDTSICLWHASRREGYNATMRDMRAPLKMDGVNDKTFNRLGGLYGLHHVSKRSLKQALRPAHARMGWALESEHEEQDGAIGIPAHTQLNSIRHAIVSGFPVAVAAEVYDNCWSPTKAVNYTIKMPDYKKDKRRGSHAFILTGYYEDYFRVKSSYGEQWGNKGYAWMHSAYLESLATEVVAVGKY